MGSRRTDRRAREEDFRASVEARLTAIEQALSLDSPGGLAAVMSVARDAAADARAGRNAAESSFVAGQAIAAVLDGKPSLGELAGAVATAAEAVREVPVAVVKALQGAAKAAPGGMGSRVPPKTPPGSKM